MFGVIRLASREKKDEQASSSPAVRPTARPLRSAGDKTAARRAITFIDYTSTLTNPRQDGSGVDKRRKDVRVHAAMASAEKRKATIARKDAYGWQRRAKLLNAIQLCKTHQPAEVLNRAASAFEVGPETKAYDLLAEFVTELYPNASWYTGPIERTSLSSKAIRTTLWGAVTNNTTLFQAAIFMAGTHSNTCGLPPTALHDLSTGMLLLRGASLTAIQAAVVSSDVESLTPVAIAMLAGWERRFGDPQIYEVHIQAWRRLSIPSNALDDNNVSSLADLTLETFREGLDERATLTLIKAEARDTVRPSMRMPPGFNVFHTSHYETRSLLRIIRELSNLDPTAPDSVQRGRRLGLEQMAWNPCHTISCQAIPAREEEWDQDELNALYHVRAASISLAALQLLNCHDYHGTQWLWDMDSALSVHTVSCQHLRTDELLSTRYAEVAVWARFTLCATSRDPERDDYIRQLLRVLNVYTWDAMKAILERYLWYEELVGIRCRSFFDLLMYEPSPSV